MLSIISPTPLIAGYYPNHALARHLSKKGFSADFGELRRKQLAAPSFRAGVALRFMKMRAKGLDGTDCQ
jgi:hypothetical protein